MRCTLPSTFCRFEVFHNNMLSRRESTLYPYLSVAAPSLSNLLDTVTDTQASTPHPPPPSHPLVHPSGLLPIIALELPRPGPDRLRAAHPVGRIPHGRPLPSPNSLVSQPRRHLPLLVSLLPRWILLALPYLLPLLYPISKVWVPRSSGSFFFKSLFR